MRPAGAFAERILRRHGLDISVRRTGSLDDAVRDADAVLVQIRVGGQAMRLQDELVPLKFDQVGQETTGAGGAMKALRTVPVVLEIAERTRLLATPDAWLVDFTNPVGIVTKNHLVTRDADLLGELAARGAAAVHLSITTLDPALQRVMEPRASTPARRLEAVAELAARQ